MIRTFMVVAFLFVWPKMTVLADETDPVTDPASEIQPDNKETETPAPASDTETEVPVIEETDPPAVSEPAEPEADQIPANEKNNDAAADPEQTVSQPAEDTKPAAGGDPIVSAVPETAETDTEKPSEPTETESEPAENETAAAAEKVLPAETEENTEEPVLLMGRSLLAAGTNASADTADTNESASANTSAADKEYIEGVAYEAWLHEGYDDVGVYYRYSDSYFSDRTEDGKENAYIYDPELSSMSSTLAATGIGSRKANEAEAAEGTGAQYEFKSRNIQTLLRELGFEDIYANEDFTARPQGETLGLVAGHKTVTYNGKTYTLIAMAPRSAQYEAEWASDVYIGADGDHAGFSYAADQLILKEFLPDYLSQTGISGDVKLWCAGMSRGAAVMNLAAAYLDQYGAADLKEQFGINLDSKNIYAYTFGCPPNALIKNTQSETIDYSHIHNVEQSYDVIAHLFNEESGMTHYGDTVLITMKEDDDALVDGKTYSTYINEVGQQYAYMVSKDPSQLEEGVDFFTYNGSDYESLAETFKTPDGKNIETLLDEVSANLANALSREEYTETIQPLLRVFGETYYSVPETQQAAIRQGVINGARAYGIQTVIQLVGKIISGDTSDISDFLISAAENALPTILDTGLTQAGISQLWDYDEHELSDEAISAVIKDDLRQTLAGLGNYVSSLRISSLSDLIRVGIKLSGIYGLVTDITAVRQVPYGGTALTATHDINIYQAWTRVLDEANHTEGGIYDKWMTPQDAWGYRMVYLPESGDYTIYVREGVDADESADYLLKFNLADGTYTYGGREGTPDWTVHIGTGDGGKGRVLYLRPGKGYTLFMYANKDLTTDGFYVDEYSYEHSYEIYKPVTADIDKETLGLFRDFNGIALSSDGTDRSDALIMHITPIEIDWDAFARQAGIYQPDQKQTFKSMRLSLAAASLADTSEALADYTLEKLVQVIALMDLDKSEIANEVFRFIGSETQTFAVTAPSVSGYQFVGWYIGDQVYTGISYSDLLDFSSMGYTVIAKYSLIPAPKQDEECVSGPENVYIPMPDLSQLSSAQESAPVRRYNVPNTADETNAGWLVLMLGSIFTALSAAYVLKTAEE